MRSERLAGRQYLLCRVVADAGGIVIKPCFEKNVGFFVLFSFKTSNPYDT